MNRQLKTLLHLVKPGVGRKLTTMQTRQKTTHDQHAKVRIFKISDFVYALRYHDDKASWVGTRHHRTKTGPISYTVRLEGRAIFRRHIESLVGTTRDASMEGDIFGVRAYASGRARRNRPTSRGLLSRLPS